MCYAINVTTIMYCDVMEHDGHLFKSCATNQFFCYCSNRCNQVVNHIALTTDVKSGLCELCFEHLKVRQMIIVEPLQLYSMVGAYNSQRTY